MADAPTVTKEQLLKLIDDLEKNPGDRVSIMGDAGISLLGAGLGAAAAGTLATAAGATSIIGISTAASWIGLTVVAATPVGWVIGCAAAAGGVAYGLSRLIRGGGLAEGRKAELLQSYREEARNAEAKEQAGSIVTADRIRFILSLRELIDKNAIPPTNAFRLIEQVEQGRISPSQGFTLIQGLLLDDEATVEAKDHLSTGNVCGNQTVSPESSAGGIIEEQGLALGNIKSFGNAIADAGSSLMTSVASTATTASAETINRIAGIFQKTPSHREDKETAVDPSLLDAERLERIARDAAPIIWMLGKTGAGKTSVIATLTGFPHAEVGNGYVSCTRTSKLFDFPQDAPLLRFLDTRGLGETGYDPSDDLIWHQSQSHLVLVVMKVSDPSQEAVLQVIKTIRNKQPDWPILVVQTGLHELYSVEANDHPAIYPFNGTDDDIQDSSVSRALRNALAFQREMFSGLNGKAPLFVPVDFTRASDGFQPSDFGKSELIDGVLSVAPEAVRLLVRLKLQQDASGALNPRLQHINMRILYWSACAAAVGAAPVVGILTVPVAQTAMLTQLANEFDVEWGVKDVSALASMLGVAIVANQGALLALRQLAKLGLWTIPIAATQDYAVTYALGRASCVYLRARKDNTDADAELVKAAFKDGLRDAFFAGGKR